VEGFKDQILWVQRTKTFGANTEVHEHNACRDVEVLRVSTREILGVIGGI
jgi:hypothetical protein